MDDERDRFDMYQISVRKRDPFSAWSGIFEGRSHEMARSVEKSMTPRKNPRINEDPER
jgi:hypothetical protein